MPIPFRIYFGACASLTDLELKFTNALFFSYFYSVSILTPRLHSGVVLHTERV